MRIGIRRETKSSWEARIPLVPDHISRLKGQGVQVLVQPSTHRVFTDNQLAEAGAVLTEDLSSCRVILGVKEIPEEEFQADTVYVFFSHTIKGQPYNMPMLRRLMAQGASLIDYERIVDDEGRRLVSFSRFAGMAGIVNTLWVYGRRMAYRGVESPFTELKQAVEYSNIREAQSHFKELGARFKKEHPDRSLVVAITGMGRVARGALEVARHLEPDLVAPDSITRASQVPGIHLALFDVGDLVERIDGGEYDSNEYHDHPDRYRSAFPRSTPYIDAMVNGIYWEEGYPRLITREAVEQAWSAIERPRLEVIGDVSCDIHGSIEITERACDPGQPSYVYDVDSGGIIDGVAGHGPVVMAVEILPAELPRDASQGFSEALVDMAPALAGLVPSAELEAWGLSAELKRGVIVHNGKLTLPYRYLQEVLDSMD